MLIQWTTLLQGTKTYKLREVKKIAVEMVEEFTEERMRIPDDHEFEFFSRQIAKNYGGEKDLENLLFQFMRYHFLYQKPIIIEG